MIFKKYQMLVIIGNRETQPILMWSRSATAATFIGDNPMKAYFAVKVKVDVAMVIRALTEILLTIAILLFT